MDEATAQEFNAIWRGEDDKRWSDLQALIERACARAEAAARRDCITICRKQTNAFHDAPPGTTTQRIFRDGHDYGAARCAEEIENSVAQEYADNHARIDADASHHALEIDVAVEEAKATAAVLQKLIEGGSTAGALRRELLAAKEAGDASGQAQAAATAYAYLIEHGWTLEADSTWHHSRLNCRTVFDGALRLQVLEEFES